MMHASRRAAAALFALAAFLTAVLGTAASAQQPATAHPEPKPEPTPIAISGQLLDVQNGYVFYTTGDAFKLDPNAHLSGYHLAPNQPLPAFGVGTYALAELDPQSKTIVAVELSENPIPGGIPPDQVSRNFVVALSPPQPNPDLVPKTNQYGRLAGYSGREVLVTFNVQVPPNTPVNADVYIATAASSWQPNAIKLYRVDGIHYGVTARIPSGTVFYYRYTRGSWQTEERNKAGLEGPVRHFVVPEADTATRYDEVYNWADMLPGATVPQLLATPPTPAPIIHAP